MKGLTSKQAEQFLNQHGLNVIKEQSKGNIFIKFLEQFNNFLTILLLFAAIVSFIIGERVDAWLIFGIVFLNALFGIYQERKAEQAILLLKKMSITKVRVTRDGREVEIDSRYLVPGDLIFVEEGMKIPADGEIIDEKNLQLNEALLTGESLPVEKKVKDTVYVGTIVVKGRAHIHVTETGMNTKMGKIAENLATIEDTKTPLQKKLEKTTKSIGITGVILALIVCGFSILQGSSYLSSFLLAVSLAVAVVPEGLPAVMTVTLAIGVKEMAKKKAIIRRLASIEALGSVTLIATDKTGTLTTNTMAVKEILVDGKIYDTDKLPSLTNNPFSKLILDGILCSTASLSEDQSRLRVLGDPTEGALLFLAHKLGLIPEHIRNEWEIVDEIPFDSTTKIMSVLVTKIPITKSQDTKKSQFPNPKTIFTKGAPESILGLCNKLLIGDREIDLTPGKVKEIEDTMEKWAKRGLRVLAFSYKPITNDQIPRYKQISNSNDQNSKKIGNWKLEIGNSQVFLGMVAIYDPPRPEVLEALAKARQAGIKAVMITGDNEITAEAIGVETGFMQKGDTIITGKQLDQYSDEELLEKLPKIKVFARTSPFHKSKIVKLYQSLGEIVAVTGDGINDAIALKQADVGIAMGLVGTDVARETADMVITDDNFATIVNAVEEGRNIIKNLKNALKYLLSCNAAEAVALVVGLMIGIPNLFFPIQLLYINLVTDGIPALAFAFSPRQEHAMTISPAKEAELITDFGKKYILMVGFFATFIVLVAYFIFGPTGAFSVLALIQSFILADLWISHHSLVKDIKKLFSGVFVIAFSIPFFAQFLIIRFPVFANGFHVKTVSLASYVAFVILASLILLFTKALRRILRH